MSKRIKMPPVLPEQRWDWLRRSEEDESVPKIARNDGYDVRTVRRHIELAKQEREVKEARFTVLRNALERHYEDLCNFAERLDPKTVGNVTNTLLPTDDNFMESALRQHLPRSPIWGYLASRRNLQQESAELLTEAKERVEQTVRAERRLDPLLSAGLSEVVPGIINALAFNIEQRSSGSTGLNVARDLRTEPAGEGLVQLCYGFSRTDIVKSEDAERYLNTLREIIECLEQDMANWEVYKNLRKTNDEISRLERKLHEELAVIRLRRIVPGRCRYCPL
ncbi:hypothetical protein ACFLX4_04175 [Chloroflexota bacterium]